MACNAIFTVDSRIGPRQFLYRRPTPHALQHYSVVNAYMSIVLVVKNEAGTFQTITVFKIQQAHPSTRINNVFPLSWVSRFYDIQKTHILADAIAERNRRITGNRTVWIMSVMIAKLSYKDRIGSRFVNNSVFIVDASWPISRKRVFKRFRFAYTFKWTSFNLFNEVIDSTKNFFISFLPVKVIRPRIIGKNEFQSKSSLSDPLPSSSWAIDSIRRLMFLGERNR